MANVYSLHRFHFPWVLHVISPGGAEGHEHRQSFKCVFRPSPAIMSPTESLGRRPAARRSEHGPLQPHALSLVTHPLHAQPLAARLSPGHGHEVYTHREHCVRPGKHPACSSYLLWCSHWKYFTADHLAQTTYFTGKETERERATEPARHVRDAAENTTWSLLPLRICLRGCVEETKQMLLKIQSTWKSCS